MANKKFSLTDILNAETNKQMVKPEQTAPDQGMDFRIQQIPIEKLHPSEDNFYGISEIEELAYSILNEGLQQNLVVVPDEHGQYKINTGHRRLAALQLLLEWGYEEYRFAPCKVTIFNNSILQELSLINTNAKTRVLSDFEKIKQAARLKELLYLAEQQGIEIKGSKRSMIAGTLNVSETQIARYETIDKHLSSDFKQAFQDEHIPVSVAAELATLSEDEQQELHDWYKEQGKQISLAKVKDKKAAKKKTPTAELVRDSITSQDPLQVTLLVSLSIAPEEPDTTDKSKKTVTQVRYTIYRINQIAALYKTMFKRRW